nr:CoA pyrophosphatase [Motilibacter deserti]
MPEALAPLSRVVHSGRREDFSRHPVPPEGGRASAVLLLFGPGPAGVDVLLLQRAEGLRHHPGQVAFPGGRLDEGDAGPVEAALREAQEETGLDPSGVEVLGQLPALFLPPSGFLVTPVLGWWRTPSAVRAGDPAEVASVHRVPVAELVDPANRLRVLHPQSGFIGPAFRVQGLLVWGFTGSLLASVLRLAGWDRPWDQSATPLDISTQLRGSEIPVPDGGRSDGDGPDE